MDDRARIEAERVEVIRRQQSRWKFLLELYRHNQNETSPGTVQSVSEQEIGRRIGLTDTLELQQVVEYLRDAGLVKIMAMGPLLRITKAGIDEVEDAYREPDKKTPHLPPLNVIYNVIHGGVHGSTVQQGTTTSTQSVDQSRNVDWDGLRGILAELRTAADRLPDEQRGELLAEIETLDAQARSPRPKTAIIRACLSSIRTLVANTAGNVAAAPLIHWMELHNWLFQ